ncbi:DUF4232 domain-containing protein [Streptomyces sp. A0642]|uniref:DUF4232 domain-containing protein n=1 Tax=Streptomyces sp. A0642 TaxID=2563100 RepID=UPI0010A212C3|nr:DUF4232 domain-containing protein [Streptomyces sp. A0642]THA62187.1 DUF4232 domain-containing protein [Streptomyces sp. A0642]
MRNLRFHRAARTSVLGAAALIASFALTACQEDNPPPYDALASASPDSTAKSPAANSGVSGDKDKETAAPSTGGDEDTAGSDKGSGSGSSGSGSGDGASAGKPQDDDGVVRLACTGANTKLTMTAVQRPVNHMLLTMTNTGSKACNAYAYPYLRFGEAQSVPNTFEDSKPQAVATIDPGQSVYAGVMTSAADGSGTNGYDTKDLSVSFQSRDGGSTGSAVKVPLARSVYVDSSLSVTYWQMSMDDALQY